MTIKALSVMPNPMYGTMVVMKRFRSCCDVGCSKAADGTVLTTCFAHTLNSWKLSLLSRFKSALANSFSSSTIAHCKPTALLVSGGSCWMTALSVAGSEQRIFAISSGVGCVTLEVDVLAS